MERDAAPFFVVGSARSGTTLLRMILNAHQDIAVPPESRFIVELWEGRREVDADGLLERLAVHKRFTEWKLPIEAVRAELGRSGTVPYPEVMGAAFAAYARSRSKARWGDKTPRYVTNIDLLVSLWPDARIVHLVRDGRDVALSYADVSFGPKNVVEAAELWAERVRAGMRSGRSLDEASYLEMRYEDLVDDPVPRLETLCDFLGLPFEQGMLDYTKRSYDLVLDRAKQYNPHLMESPRRTRSWQQSMTDDQVELFEAVAGDVLSEFDYARRFDQARPKTKILLAAARLGAPVGRLKPSRR